MGTALLSAFTICSTLWIAVWLAKPRRPLGMEMERWLVWSRYENSWRLLLAFALCVSMLTVMLAFMAMTQAPTSEFVSQRAPCHYEPTYYAPSPPPGWWQWCNGHE